MSSERMYVEQLRSFNIRCTSLDEQLTSFFSRLFSKEQFVPFTFFSLIEKLKCLEGSFIATQLGRLGEGELNKIIHSLCQAEGNKSQYIFSKGKISLARSQQSSCFYDAEREIEVSELHKMSDLDFFSFLNAHDLPYLRASSSKVVEDRGKEFVEDAIPFINRSAFEHFFRDFLDRLKELPILLEEKKSYLRFNLLENCFGYLAISITSNVQLLYMMVESIKRILTLSYTGMKSELPNEYPLMGKIIFFDQFVAARTQFVETRNVPEMLGSCRDFVRVDFMSLMRGSEKDKEEMSELGLFDYLISQLDELIATGRRQIDMGNKFFRDAGAQNHLPAEGIDFCHACIGFQSRAQSFLDDVSKKDGGYRLALHEGRKLLSSIYPEEYLYGEPDPKSSSGSSTPRAGATTPRLPFLASPRASGTPNSPRRAQLSVSCSPTGSPRNAPTKAELIEMWKRKSGANVVSSTEKGAEKTSDPALSHSSGGIL